MGGWDGLSEDKANLSPPVGFELGLGAELGNNWAKNVVFIPLIIMKAVQMNMKSA